MSIRQLTANCTHYLADQQGQGFIEYVLLVTLVAITLIGSLISLEDIIYNVLTNIPFPAA